MANTKTLTDEEEAKVRERMEKIRQRRLDRAQTLGDLFYSYILRRANQKDYRESLMNLGKLHPNVIRTLIHDAAEWFKRPDVHEVRGELGITLIDSFQEEPAGQEDDKDRPAEVNNDAEMP